MTLLDYLKTEKGTNNSIKNTVRITIGDKDKLSEFLRNYINCGIIKIDDSNANNIKVIIDGTLFNDQLYMYVPSHDIFGNKFLRVIKDANEIFALEYLKIN